MANLEANEFLVVRKPLDNPQIRLVCFPHSGGGPSAFAAWADRLEDALIEVVAISAPGRERRVDRPSITGWPKMITEITQALKESGLVDGVPYAFFGHSLGALLAYETARHLDRDMLPGRPRPVHLFVSGHGGPVTTKLGRKVSQWGHLHEVSDAELMEATRQFGFLPGELASNQELLRAVLPALRADFELYEKYVPETHRPLLEVAITAMGGDEDVVAPVDHLETWQQETTIWTAPKVFAGDHFYLQAQSKEVLQFLSSRLQDSVASLPSSLVTSEVLIPQVCQQKLIHEVIEEWARKQPSKDATVDETGRLTFAELVKHANLLGGELASPRFLDGRTKQVVALLMPHGNEYVVGMLGIWYASGIIIVIEAHFPETLCKEICEDNSTAAAVASPNHAFKFASVANCKTLTLGADWVKGLEGQNGAWKTLPRADPQDTAILMMTSGTTGKPKTIAGSHFFMHFGALAKDLYWPHAKESDCREAFNVMFVWEVLRSPLLGNTAFCVPDEAVLDPQLFVSFLQKHSCSRVLTTPSLLLTILKSTKDLEKRLPAMRTWYTCGEVLPMKQVRSFREALPECQLVNDYSTWESGDVGYATVAPSGKYEPHKVFALAAQELTAGLTAAVVDPESKKLVPRGLVGELYVGGVGLSYGYPGHSELTASKFIDGINQEMVAASGGKWKFYKTGDSARFVGEPPALEIRGRIDSTVKIRGFKVGIPVVEGAVGKVSGVAVCAVVPVYENAAVVDSLLCFVKPEEGTAFDAVVQRIKQEAVKEIPRVMMPTYFQPLPADAFSGGEARKLDRKRLQGLADLKMLKESQVVPAERKVVDVSAEDIIGARGVVRSVWAKVLSLSIDMVDPEENFFDLGGHSALAAQMATELSGEYGLPITVMDIYSHSTLQALSDFAEFKDKGNQIGVEGRMRARTRSRIPSSAGGEVEAPKIAVAGFSGRFPGADTAESFWENIVKATVSMTMLSKELLRGKGVPETTIGHKGFVPCAYMISDPDLFDNAFFGIGRHEASMMDPQHRVFIEASWAAMENAALPPKGGLSSSVVGVFAASGIDGYLVHHLDGRPLKDTMDPQDIFLAEIGNEKDYIATRVSYLLDFTGPSMNVNSACSSALVAVAQGASAIASNQCDAAVAGASSITFPNLGYLYADGLVSSVDGYVRPFDAGADGTVFGDSVAALVLRKEKDAGAAGLMYAGLRGFAVSNDGGQKAGYAAPSSNGQARAVMSAMAMMKEDPWSIGYVECHCTGTRIGDGIEIHGLLSSFEKMGGNPAENTRIALGSVKGNIAHANCAAGATGLIKALKIIENKSLAPTANFKQLNPKINLDKSPFFVNDEVCPFEAKEAPLRAGVSSFGIGGTNAHTILEEIKPRVTHVGRASPLGFQLLTFSAKSPKALYEGAQRLKKSLKASGEVDTVKKPDMSQVAYTLQAGRVAQPLRKAIVVSAAGGSALLKAAEDLEANFPEQEELEEVEDAKKRPPVAFVFPGQGSQYLGMALGLYQQVALFKSCVDECCDMLAQPKHLGHDLRPLLFTNGVSKEKAKEEFEKPTVMQPALFVVEYAMAKVLLEVGVKPVACAGHSLGEYAAAVIGGFITLESAVAIVARRATSTENLAEVGAMLSVLDWTSEELQDVDEGKHSGLWLAAVNSPKHAVISGEVAAIDKLEADLNAAGKKCGRLHVKRAFHSGLIAKAAETLSLPGMPEEMHGGTTTPVASNLTGGWMTAAQLKDGYWTKHMRGTVLWRENAERLMQQWRPAIVLEVGPGNVLSTLTAKCVQRGGPKPEFVQSMRHPKATGTHDVEALFSCLGKLWEAGVPIDWNAFHTIVLQSEQQPSLLRLPAYAFDPTSLWVNPERSVYVNKTEDPSPAAYVASEATATPSSSSRGVLVRYGDDREVPPAIKAYCLPFASGSSGVFAPWAQEDPALEVVAVELPGRGARSEEAIPADDAGDDALLETLIKAILADLRGAQLVLVGFSMGGGLAMELAFRLAAKPGAPVPLAVYVAGRKPPASDPSLVPAITMTDSELAAYAFAPPETAESPEFREHVLPLLRADLEADARCERRLSKLGQAGTKLAADTAVELYCGTSDTVAPFEEAEGWQKWVEAHVGVHYMPGGHEFMQERRDKILASWRRDALGRLVQRRSAEVALLAAQGFAAPGAVPAGLGRAGALVASPAATSSAASSGDTLPLYAVRWQQVPKSGRPSPLSGPAPCLVQLDVAELTQGELERVSGAAKAGAQIVAACCPSEGVFRSQAMQEEVRASWHFVKLVQMLLQLGVTARLLVVCPDSITGAMVAGASKAVAMEAAELKIQRLFTHFSLQSLQRDVSKLCELANFYSGETDLWVKNASMQFVPRLERMTEPSARGPCIRAHGADGELANFLLTGATGGLGKAVVSWLIKEQGLQPSQLLLLRRAGSSKLEGDLALCRVVEVSKVDDADTIRSALKEIRGVCGIFHLAGVLDDGIVGGMTHERMQKVAQPKCGMLAALLNSGKELNWPLQWCLAFSSTSSLFGYAGQVNYCAANAMLDQQATFGNMSDASLVEGDRAPCRLIAVNWGPWGEAGMAQVGTKAYEAALKEGDTPLSTATALRCLAVALRQASQAQPSATQLCACDVQWQKSQWQDLPILEHVHDRVATEADAKANGAAEENGSKESSVQAFLAQQAKSGGGSWGRVKGKSLHQLGLDSLELVQLRNQFNKKYNVNVPLGVVADPSQKLGELSSALLKFVDS